jgi:hypothetical protein
MSETSFPAFLDKIDPNIWLELQKRWNAYSGMQAELMHLRRLRKAAIELSDWYYRRDGLLPFRPSDHATLTDHMAVLENALAELEQP